MENISYTYYYVQCMWSYMYTHSEKTRIPHYQDHTLGLEIIYFLSKQ